MENNENKWTTIKVDSMYQLIDPSGAFVASASKLNCDSIANTLNNYQALKEENEEYVQYLKELKYLCSRVGLKTRAAEIKKLLTQHSI
jgi:cell shape-determining protein MreC